MTPKNKRMTGTCLLMCMLLTTFFSCAAPASKKPQDVPTEAAETAPPEAIRRIVIYPFTNMSAIYGENQTVLCPFCLSYYTTGTVTAEAADRLTEILVQEINERDRFEIISVDAAMAMGDAGGFDPKKERERIMEAGRLADADAVLVGHVYRYVERVGTGYGIQTPASVLFDMDLIRVADGHTVWNVTVDETQKSLLENLFNLDTFLKRKARWLKVDELSRFGIQAALGSLP